MNIKPYLYNFVLLGLGLGSSSITHAGTMGPSCSPLCSAPMKSGIYAGVSGLYLKPSQSVLPADSWQYTNAGVTTSIAKTFAVPEYWAVGAKVGYNFGESANDLEFDYLNFNSTTREFYSSVNHPSSFGSPRFDINLLDPASVGFYIDAKLKYTLNQYDLFFGHTYSFMGNGFSLKPSIGVRYATLDTSAVSTTPAGLVSHFRGVGPELALDARQDLIYGFGLTGHFDAAVMASSVNASSYLVIFPIINGQYKSPSRDRVTNAMTGKIGLDYHYVFSNDSSLVLEAGYQATRYAEVINTIYAQAVTVDGSQQISSIVTESFSLMGLYLGLTAYI